MWPVRPATQIITIMVSIDSMRYGMRYHGHLLILISSRERERVAAVSWHWYAHLKCIDASIEIGNLLQCTARRAHWAGINLTRAGPAYSFHVLTGFPFAGRSYVGINEEIMWVSIGMGVTIALLITIALCYIAREKCQKRQREYYVTA